MTPGMGKVYGTLTQQKIDIKGLTESELGVSGVMPQILWTRYFLESQGYFVADSVIFEDNQSPIFLEKDSKTSSGARRRHINIRYFFGSERMSAQYCATGDMAYDFFAKTWQGSIFKHLRDQIMNINPTNDSSQDC